MAEETTGAEICGNRWSGHVCQKKPNHADPWCRSVRPDGAEATWMSVMGSAPVRAEAATQCPDCAYPLSTGVHATTCSRHPSAGVRAEAAKTEPEHKPSCESNFYSVCGDSQRCDCAKTPDKLRAGDIRVVRGRVVCVLPVKGQKDGTEPARTHDGRIAVRNMVTDRLSYVRDYDLKPVSISASPVREAEPKSLLQKPLNASVPNLALQLRQSLSATADSGLREAEPTPQPRQAAQYRPGGVFMFNTTTRAMENCENELFVKASELDKAEAQWIRIAAEDVRDAKSSGLREAEPLKALVDEFRALANQYRPLNASFAYAYDSAADKLSAALEGAATKGQ